MKPTLTFYPLYAIIVNEMWEFARTTSHGGKSVRRIFYFALATVVATFLLAFVAVKNTYAADATWNTTNSIKYGDNTYNGPTDKVTNGNLKLPESSKTYTFVDPETTASGDNTVTTRKIHVIYFAPDANLSTNTSAKYETFTYQSTSSFTDPSSPIDISIDVQSAGLASPGTTSCDGSVTFSLGWIVCPVTNFLANGMDWIFNIISGFLSVRPVQTDQNNALFRAWTYVRSFANIAFVITFLIIIYSQLTNFGISNYGIKKLMPRLIIAAILVNVSYYICAVVIDLSNIMGYGVQDVFISIRNGLVGTEGNSWNVISFQSIAGFVLSGGTAVAAGTIGLISTLSTYGVAGSIFLLLPSLVIALMAVLIALLILATRQAIVTLLVIIAPLAFVAYLLPNTEKWFEKWRSTMMTMLVLFPAFSFVFGGAQLASAVIIQNADSINVIILALLVQVAPLLITPMLIKLSGSIIGKVAGLVNNPNKGPIDRVKKFTEDRTGNIAAKRLGTNAHPGRRGAFQRRAQNVDHKRRQREAWKSAHTGVADARWAGSEDFSNIDQVVRQAQDAKSLGESQSELRYINKKTVSGQVKELEAQLRSTKMDLDVANLKAEIQWDKDPRQAVAEQATRMRRLTDEHNALNLEYDAQYEISKTKQYQETEEFKAQSAVMKKLILEANEIDTAHRIQTARNDSAKRYQQLEFGTELSIETNTQLREAAGAHIIDDQGAVRALANAIAVINRNRAEVISNHSTYLNDAYLGNKKDLQLALGKDVMDSSGKLIKATPEMVEAAIARVIDQGPVVFQFALAEQLDLKPGSNKHHRTAFVDSMKKSSRRTKALSNSWLNDITQGLDVDGKTAVDNQVVKTITDDKVSADFVTSQDVDTIERISQALSSGRVTIDRFNSNPAVLATMRKQIELAYSSKEFNGRIGQSDKHLKEMLKWLDDNGVHHQGEES